VSLLVGDLLYALEARRLAWRQGRGDVCALLHGINTVMLFGNVLFLVACAGVQRPLGFVSHDVRVVAGRARRTVRESRAPLG
jgi:hypothetical protein